MTTHTKRMPRLATLAAATLLLGGTTRATQLPCADTLVGSARHESTATTLAVGLGPVGFSSDASTRLTIGPLVCLQANGGGGASGSCDSDPQINAIDWACLLECLEGPAQPVNLDCLTFDFDNDGNVDLQDVAQFNLLYEG